MTCDHHRLLCCQHQARCIEKHCTVAPKCVFAFLNVIKRPSVFCFYCFVSSALLVSWTIAKPCWTRWCWLISSECFEEAFRLRKGLKSSAPDRVVIDHARETESFEIVVALHSVRVFLGNINHFGTPSKSGTGFCFRFLSRLYVLSIKIFRSWFVSSKF